MGDWRAQRDYLATLYNNERSFDYAGYRDRVADEQWQKEFEASIRPYNESLAEEKRKNDAKLAKKASSGGKSGKDAQKKKEAEYGPGISTQRNVSGIKGSGWDYTKHTLEMLLRGGNVTGAANYMDTIVDEVNEGQYNELENMWKKYVGSY